MRLRSWITGCGTFLAAAGAMSTASGASAQPAAALTTDAVVRVVDIGAGLCVVIVVPGGHGMLYDAARSAGSTGGFCRRAVAEMLPGRRLDLVVLSHSDSDHVRELPGILDDNAVAMIIHPGDPRGETLDPITAAITREAANGADVRNLRQIDAAVAARSPGAAARVVSPGDSFAIGTARATFVAGWGDGRQARSPDERELRGSHMHNGLSIVIRFTYGGHSVLLTGDTVGVLRGDGSRCEYAERVMVERATLVPINSDVLIGQHHGAENATSTCFARAVSPETVVFSAGHDHNHPREVAVVRLRQAMPAVRIFRTDRDDNEGPPEMVDGSGRCPDRPGDDDVEIRLPLSPSSPVRVRYRGASRACP